MVTAPVAMTTFRIASAVGATQAVFEAGFSAPRWYDFIARHRGTVFYTAPTAIRMLMKAPPPTAHCASPTPRPAPEPSTV